MSARDLYTQYIAAHAALKGLDAGVTLEANFTKHLDMDESLFLEYYNERERKRMQEATSAYTTLLLHFADLKRALNDFDRLPAVQGLPQAQKDALKTAAQTTYATGLSFTQALLKEGKVSQFLPVVSEVLVSAIAITKDPTAALNLSNLKRNMARLNSQLETNELSHALWNTGRAFLGSLICLGGAALILAALSSGLGLIVTVIIALVTRGESFGPLSWGKDLCVYGADMVTGGPTFFEGAEATKWDTQLAGLKTSSETIQGVPQPR